MIISRNRFARVAVTASGAALCATLTASAAPAGAVTPVPVLEAHRGVWTGSYAGTPEDSLYAYQAADNLGISQWETDVRFTKDNVPYQLHDATLTRTTTCTGPLESRNSSVFRNSTCKYKNGLKIESFYWTLKVLDEANARLTLELKTVPTDAQLTALKKRLVATNTLDQVDFSSFDRTTLAILRKWFPNNRRVFISSTLVSGIAVKRNGASIVALKYTVLTKPIVTSFHNQGIKVIAWTANDSATWASLQAMGVDSIDTNEPEAYQAFFRPAVRR